MISGLALVWVVSALLVAWMVVAAGCHALAGGASARGGGGGWFGLVDLGRNPVLLVLFASSCPAVFVCQGDHSRAPLLVVAVAENGTTSNQPFWLPEIHAGAMAPVGIGGIGSARGNVRCGRRRWRRSAAAAARLPGHQRGAGSATRRRWPRPPS